MHRIKIHITTTIKEIPARLSQDLLQSKVTLQRQWFLDEEHI
ncbi:MAG: hypothetical protein Q7J19_08950 [Lutibacter sp.]|nr:hypothetical protein [Lutibacter sp.]